MKGYILFLIFVLGSFAMASETQGLVRIKDSQPARYDNAGKLIPGSMNTILKIEKIFIDNQTPDVLVLIPAKNATYDYFVINFEKFRDKNLATQNFGMSLKKGFLIEVQATDLEFLSVQFMSVLEIDANKIDVLSRRGMAIAIKSCTETGLNRLNTWINNAQPNCLN